MKIAVAADGQQVSTHFGHCEAYVIADISGGRVADVRTLPNPGHEAGALPVLLRSHHVDTVIAGGMGARAAGLFAAYGIGTITGVTGSVQDALARFAAGDLESQPGLCDQSGRGHGSASGRGACSGHAGARGGKKGR